MEHGSLNEDIVWWKSLFKDIPARLLLLPFSRVQSRLPMTGYDAIAIKGFVGKGITARIKELSRKMQLTWFHFYTAAPQVLLFRALDGVRDAFRIGIAAANRLDEQHLETLGFFLNLLLAPLNI